MPKPLIFLGTSNAMYKQTEVCEMLNIPVHGIIDGDYFQNTETCCDLPVIDSPDAFQDPEKLEYYKQNFDFFCAINWIPENNPVHVRNKQKRLEYIELIDHYKLNCISIVDPRSRISRHATIGKGCFIDGGVMIEHHCEIGDFVNIYSNSEIGHGTKIGRNCVIQRRSGLSSFSILKENVFISCAVLALKSGVTYGENTFIHEGVYIKRGTIPGEVVGQNGNNMKRVQVNYVE